MAERCLITGAAGFVGACLARRLVAERAEVHGIVRDRSNLWRLEDIRHQLHLHTLDLADANGLTALVEEIEPDVIYHLAAHGGYPEQTDVDAMLHANVLGTWNLLRACERIDYQLFVNAGSSSEYGFKSAPMREDDLLEPNSYYAVTKATQTHLCRYVARSQQRPLVTLRLFSVYGPYEEPTRLIPTVIRNCFAGRALSLVAPDTGRDFVFIDDVVDALMLTDQLAQHAGEVFNIASGQQRTVREVVEQLVALTGANVKLNWDAMTQRIWDSPHWIAEVSKARDLLGWRAATSLENGLTRTVEWQRTQPCRAGRPDLPERAA